MYMDIQAEWKGTKEEQRKLNGTWIVYVGLGKGRKVYAFHEKFLSENLNPKP